MLSGCWSEARTRSATASKRSSDEHRENNGGGRFWRISACLIVRDEARNLPDCLASLAELDEIVVCDTGSRDDTVAIAEAAGVRVVHFDWCDDFSAARNAAIRAATSEFVLVIDADERLAAGGNAELRRAAAEGCVVGLVPILNADRADRSVAEVVAGVGRLGEPLLAPRFVRVDAAFRYEGRVHEDFGAWLSTRLDGVRRIEATLVHFGGAPSVRRALRKDDRNLRLLRLDVEERPDDAYRWGHLARAAWSRGLLDVAESAAETGWAALPRERGVPCGWLGAVRAMARHQRGDAVGALQAVSEAWERGSELVDLALIACEVLRSEVAFAPTSEAAWHAAQQSLACAGKAAAAHGRAQFEEGSLGSTTTVAQAARAAALLVLGRAVEARLAIDAAEAHGFPADEIAMMRAEASILAGDAGDALALAAALPDPWPDTWALRAAAHALAGEEGLAQQAADEAAARSATGWRLAHRATWVPALRAATTKDFSPIFVFGADRSGTTLLRAMLDAHPRIAIGPETNLVEAIGALRDAQASDPHRPLSDRGVPVRALDRAVRAYIERLLMELAGEKPRVGEKTPANLYHVHLLARLFPRARFIHVVRDGRDVAASLVAQAWRDPASGALFSHCSDPVSAARYWQEAAGRAFFGVARAPGRALTIHYDALVAEPEATLRRVLRFLGEPWSASVLDPGAGARFSEREASTAAVREPIHGRAVSRAQRDFDAPTLAAVEAACGSLLREVHPASAPNRSNACVA